MSTAAARGIGCTGLACAVLIDSVGFSSVALALAAATLLAATAALARPWRAGGLRDRVGRVGAVLGSAALLAAGLWASAVVSLLAAVAWQQPDPSVADGDPCCGHRDTWGEVASGTGVAAVAAVVAGAVLAAGIVLAHSAGRGSWPRRPRSPRAWLAQGAWVVFLGVGVPCLEAAGLALHGAD